MSSTDARSSITLPDPDRAFRRFAFLALTVMTRLYARYRHDVMFLQEHCRGARFLPRLPLGGAAPSAEQKKFAPAVDFLRPRRL